MHEVAHHLQCEALKLTGNSKDLFARSAYNRYYYSLFLLTRTMIMEELRVHSGNLSHSDYPAFIKGTLVKSLKKGNSTARKNGDISLLRQIKEAVKAANNLADLMSLAYASRVVADYEPSVKVDFLDKERFELKGIEITQAHQWLNRANVWRKSIVYAWRQIHVE